MSCETINSTMHNFTQFRNFQKSEKRERENNSMEESMIFLPFSGARDIYDETDEGSLHRRLLRHCVRGVMRVIL